MGRTPSVATTSAAVRSSIRNWRPARPWKRRGWKSPKTDFPTPLGNPAKCAGFPLLEWPAACFTGRTILVGRRRFIMDIYTLGIDRSKTTFHVIGFNAGGEIVLRRKFSRKHL